MFLKATTETKEHAPSYYAASANWQTDYPQLEGDLNVDVVVVGAGLVALLLPLSFVNAVTRWR